MRTRTTAGTVPRPVRLAAAVATSVLVAAGASSCGSSDDETTTATDSSATSEQSGDAPEASTTSSDSADSPSEGAGATIPVGEAVEPGQALVVSASDVEAPTSELATALVDEASVETFVADIDPRLAAEVRAAVEDVDAPAQSTLFGAVVSVGCEEPDSVSWEKTFDGIEAAAPLPKSDIQCLVPVTSVALFLVDDL